MPEATETADVRDTEVELEPLSPLERSFARTGTKAASSAAVLRRADACTGCESAPRSRDRLSINLTHEKDKMFFSPIREEKACFPRPAP